MRMSHMFYKTEKQVTADAVLASHRLLVQAGLIKQVAAGMYSLSPIGYRAVRRIEQLLREEMDAIGGQEILMPILQPAALWRESGRLDGIDQELVRLQDRSGQQMVLAMTHEEAVTDMARHYIHSYRQLPMMAYQIQTKVRDEARPRGGLVRLREFLMKDAYSFHADSGSLDAFYEEMITAYESFYRRAGIDVLKVDSDTGVMGGGSAHEFMLVTDGGEDTLIVCPPCDYAANKEVAAAGPGQSCAHCGGTLQAVRGIEVGNIFKLGTKYSYSMKAEYTDADGHRQPLVMGCYGIGISRMLAAIIEQNHDDKGIVWPTSVAPFAFHLVAVGNDEDVVHTAASVYTELGADHVLYDDRNTTPGVKFMDADLLGLPTRLTVSRRSLNAGGVEVQDRTTGNVRIVHAADIQQALM